MLTIEIKVNGSPIVVVDAHRGDDVGGAARENRKHDYPYRGMVFPIDMTEAPTAVLDKVLSHRYDDGLVELCARILTQMAEEMKRAQS